MPRLIIRRGPEPGKIFNVVKDSVQIGRGARNEIVIEDNEVSREHCRLVRVDNHFELVDLDSSNGTFVNGQRVRDQWPLRADCLIELGDTITLEYQMSDEASTNNGIADAPKPEPQEVFFVVSVTSQPNRAIYPLRGDIVDVGRGTANDIIIVEAEMSRNHMRLKRADDNYVLIDLNSTNGTTVNGQEVKDPQLLVPGDVIRVGTTITIQYTLNPEAFLGAKPTEQFKTTSDESVTTQRNPLKRLGVTTFLAPPPETSSVGTGVEPEALADQIFIVYDRKAWEGVVAPLVDALYQEQLPAWVDQYLTPGGDDWLAAIEQARLECWMLVLIVSPALIELEYVGRVLRHFHNREKPILLFIHEPVERLPVGANQVPQIRYNPGQPKEAFQQAINTIKQMRERRNT